ncbi:MAG: exonuclease SbcCD subunit D [Clostridia bacterium]|nr:exonuclease SbcCD subunit D [Clostridia bacterium]
MRILHTGDIHLDSPFSGMDVGKAESRRRELRETFIRMMRYAADEKLDMVIIAGDLFDGAYVTRETVACLIREFSRLSCPVIIAPGNHDPADEQSVWQKTVFPENVHIFKSNKTEKFSFDDLECDVYGYGFVSARETNCLLWGSVEDESRINILAVHGDTTSPLSSNAPLPVAVIRSFGADYAALGHIHNPAAANATLSDVGAYCGCPEGRDFGECGEKGAIVAEITKDGTKKEFVRFSKRVYIWDTLNIDASGDMGQIMSKVSGYIESKGYGNEVLLRLTLTGSVEPSLVINTAHLCEAAGPLFHLEVEDATSPTWNADTLLSDMGIRGELYRTLLPDLESADREKRDRASLALRYALAALSGEDISDI